MTLDTPWQIEQTWGSNQAVLKGVVQVLQPGSAIECGCGNYSTPILRDGVPHLLTLEHDAAWLKKVMKLYPPVDAHSYGQLALPGVRNWTDRSEVAEGVLKAIERFYVSVPLESSAFVLIDTYRCARAIAAKVLMERTGLMMLHDVRPSSRDYYHYHDLDEPLADWHRYEHRPEGMINVSHAIPWTALYSREPLDLEALNVPIVEESKRLWNLDVGLEEING